MSRNQILLGVIVAALLVLAGAAWYMMGSSPSGPTAGPVTAPGTTADDMTLGDPKAKIVVIEYAAPMCPHCAHMNEEGIPVLTANYINTGKVFYIFRVYPIGPPDVAAESLARCLPKANYFSFIDLLFRNQAKWDPENGITDVEGGLAAIGRIAGLSNEQITACMHDPVKNKRVMDGAKDAQTRFDIHGTPTFVINGEVQTPGAPWADIKAKLDSLLAKK